jgi:transposase
MVTPPEIEAQILRYYHAEKWRIGTIAAQLHVHHSVVRRVLAQAGLPRPGPSPRPSPIDAYLAFILQTLEKFPTLTASRLFAMVHERGYRGSPDHFRHLIAQHRPRRPAEAYLRLRSLPGEQAQVDWGLCRARHRPHYAENLTMPSILETAAVSAQSMLPASA